MKHWLALLALTCLLFFGYGVATGKLGSITLRIHHSLPDFDFQYQPPQPPAAPRPPARHRHAAGR